MSFVFWRPKNAAETARVDEVEANSRAEPEHRVSMFFNRFHFWVSNDASAHAKVPEHGAVGDVKQKIFASPGDALNCGSRQFLGEFLPRNGEPQVSSKKLQLQEDFVLDQRDERAFEDFYFREFGQWRVSFPCPKALPGTGNSAPLIRRPGQAAGLFRRTLCARRVWRRLLQLEFPPGGLFLGICL